MAANDFDALSRRLRPPLLKFFQRRTRSHADSEDLVQELFARLLRRQDVLGLKNPDGYVFQAAANLSRDLTRQDIVRSADRHDDVFALELPSEVPGPEQALASRQALDQVLAALDALPARTRSVIMLRRFEDLSYAEIAARLGISVSAVEKHVVRAMDALREED